MGNKSRILAEKEQQHTQLHVQIDTDLHLTQIVMDPAMTSM